MTRWLRHPLAAAALIGLLAGGITAFFLVSSAGEADGWPVEQAEVIAIEEPAVLDGLTDDCGRSGGPARDVTLRSIEPPPGLDEIFTVEDECHTDDVVVGEVWPVARVIEGNGDVTVHMDPQTPSEALRGTLIAAGGAFVATAVLLYGRQWWTGAQERPGRVRY